MFRALKNLFNKSPQIDAFTAAVDEAAKEAAAGMDWDDPSVRTGASIYLVLSKQFDLLGKPEGVFPFTAPFATDKARGALLGTAISIARQQHGELQHHQWVDAAVTAFTLAYGKENGKFYAVQAMQDFAGGNEDVNFASDWAVKDTDGANRDDLPATPAAFYLAVAGMM